MAWLAASPLAAVFCPNPQTVTLDTEPNNVVVQASVAGGDEIEVLVAYKNKSNVCWYNSGSEQIRLKLDGQSASVWQIVSGDQMADEPIAPGSTALFKVALKAPATAGDYDLQFDLQHGATLFNAPSVLRSVEVSCSVAPGDSGAGNNAAILSLDTPLTVAVGGEFEVRATVENTGTNCWNTLDVDRPFQIGRNPPIAGGPEGTWPIFHRHALDPALLPVQPGDTVTLSYRVKAPLTLPADPTHAFAARMMQARAPGESVGYSWFGEQKSNVMTVTDAPSLDAEVVDVDVPAVVVGGKSYAVRVTLLNTGSETWEYSGTAASGIVLGMPGNPASWAPSRQMLPHRVVPNERVTFEFEIHPEANTALAPLQWKMLEVGPNNGWFGDQTASQQAELRDMTYPIVVDEDRFVEDDPNATSPNEYVMRGFNYLPYYEFEVSPSPEGSSQDSAWRHYKEEVTEREFRDMARLGANTVRFWLSDEYLEDTNPPLTQAQTCDRLNHALDEAYRNGMCSVLSLRVNRQHIFDAHCPGDLCAQNVIGKAAVLFYEEDFRNTIVTNNMQLLKDCEVLETAEPRVFSIEFWQEPETGGVLERQKLSPSREWHEYVVAEYCTEPDPDPDPNSERCCLPTELGCDVDDTLTEAFAAWGYGTVAGEVSTDCGGLTDPGDPSYLCPPNNDQLCTGDASSAWHEMTKEYRKFVDDRAHDAYAYAISELDDTIADLTSDPLVGHVQDPMVTLGYASAFARNSAVHKTVCSGANGNEGRGYFLDPRHSADLFDYASIHLYPWSDIWVSFDDAVAMSSGFEALEPEKRYDQMRFLLDYIRAERPVVMEEVGYNTCIDSAAEILLHTGKPGGDSAGCSPIVKSDLRDPIQEEVWMKEAENLARVHANGALYWAYRDRVDRGQWGARRLDDSEKPVYDDILDLFTDIKDGRNPPTTSHGCLQVDPYAQPNWNLSLMESFDDYLLAAEDSLGEVGPVDLVLVGESCP